MEKTKEKKAIAKEASFADQEKENTSYGRLSSGGTQTS